MKTETFRDADGLEVMRTDIITEEHTVHQIAMAHDGGAMGLYTQEHPLDLMVVLYRPHEPAAHWRRTVSRSVEAEDEESTITAREGQEMLDFWDLVRRVSLAGSVPE